MLGPSNNTVRNVLFIMADQLRRDYLSCYGHPTLHTPHIDALAKQGVRFDRAYVQGPVCGPSRMSYYTGRYVTSHGAIWNFVPLSVREQGLGDYLRPHGIRTAVAGKTHMEADVAGMRRLGIDPQSPAGVLAMELGFEPFDRDDGVWPPGFVSEHNQYTAFLKQHGYVSNNPWHDFANAAAGPNGEVLSGWEMRYAHLPARVKAEHSETPYMTNRAIDFIREQGEAPWCLHLSYIKPHWPYVAPAPYHEMYTADDVVPVKQHAAERGDGAHPVMQGFQRFTGAEHFSQEAIRRHVVPTYMGLVKQLDDEIGRLMAYLKQAGRLDDTLIVFCSDHGDYLGDHYLAEKELFHDTVARVPLIIYDPRREADGTRGTMEARLVESIDVVPTILEALGVMPAEHILEGASLQPLLHGEVVEHWREAVFSEMNYAFRDFVRLPLEQPIDRCHGYMVRDERWKCVFFDDLRPQLFDLETDPDEFHDLGADPAHAAVRERARARLFDWLRHRKIHPTFSYPSMGAWNRKQEDLGIHVCAW